MTKATLQLLVIILVFIFPTFGKVNASTSEYLKDNDPEKYKEFIEDSIQQAYCPIIGQCLIDISQLGILNDSLISKTDSLLKENDNIQCFIDDIVIEKDSQNPTFQGLTYTIGKICEKANSKKSVQLYLKYVRANYNSAEEEISFALERLFMKNPSLFLKEINNFPDVDKTQFIQNLVWGFLNNRYYGSKGQFVDLDQKAFMEGKKRNPVLNAENYKDIFFEINSDLKSVSKKYPEEFLKILNGIKDYLESQE